MISLSEKKDHRNKNFSSVQQSESITAPATKYSIFSEKNLDQ
jgi:hypothetical protein